MGHPPDGDHVTVHLLELLLCRLQRVRWRVELVRLEALVAQIDGKWLIVRLVGVSTFQTSKKTQLIPKTPQEVMEVIVWLLPRTRYLY